MALPSGNSVPLTGDAFIDGLTQGGSWTFAAGATFTYSFSLNDTPGNQPAWTSGLAAAFVQALTAWSNVANITFVESGSGTLFTNSTADIAATLTGNELQQFLGAAALGIFPDPSYATDLLAEVGYDRMSYPRPEGDVFFDNGYPGFGSLAPGQQGLAIMIHEVGHALGLKHPSDDGGNSHPTYAGSGIPGFDNLKYTVMNSSGFQGPTIVPPFPGTPMLLDILAIQRIYGANHSHRTGDDVYALQSDMAYRTIWDAGGNDTLDASALPFVSGLNPVIDLNGGAYSGLSSSSSLTAIAYNVVIENVIGSAGHDTITGNAAANNLAGGDGIDTIIGGDGDDVLNGGAGSNTLSGGSGNDTITGSAFDIIDGGIGNDTIAMLAGTAHGGAGNDTITGNGVVEVFGDDGDDSITLLISGTAHGGAGNDSISSNGMAGVFGDDGNDAIALLGGGTANGGGGADSIQISPNGGNAYGDAGNDTLTGSGGIDLLDGGTGIDALSGGDGNDTYVLDDPADSAMENANAGTDLVQSSFSYALNDHFENLTLLGIAGINGTGNALPNTIAGNDGDNILGGGGSQDKLRGGAGNDVLDGGADLDQLQGGTGNDTYVLDASLVAVPTYFSFFGDPGEWISQGQSYFFTPGMGSFTIDVLDSANDADTLVDSIGVSFNNFAAGGSSFWSLNFSTRMLGQPLQVGTYVNAERDSFASPGHPGMDISGDGRGSNTLTGTFTVQAASFDYSGATPQVNELSIAFEQHSEGGPLALYGTLSVNHPGGISDHVMEGANAGIDTVESPITTILPANVENLVLTGSANVGGTGNALDNVLTGNSGVNTLTGGAGNDTYFIQTAGDAPVENPGEGTDTVMSPMSYTLPANFENLALTGISSINGTGNGDGNVLTGNAGVNVLDGGAGFDFVSYVPAPGGVSLSLGAGGAGGIAAGDTYLNIEGAIGSSFADVLTGNGSANTLKGGAGNDTLNGLDGNDTLDGGEDIDTADFGGFGAAVWVDLTYPGPEAWTRDGMTVSSGTWRVIADLANIENLVGSALNDSLTGDGSDNVFVYTGGRDFLDGGLGTDSADFSRFGSAMWVDLTYAGDEAWTRDGATVLSGTWRRIADLANVENLIGSAFDDSFTGNGADNVLAYTGGRDLLDGGSGTDSADFSRFGSAVWVDLTYPGVQAWTRDAATLVSGPWRAIADVINVENLIGSAFDDSLAGNGADNVLVYTGGRDVLNGVSGTDTADFSRFGSAVWVDLTYPGVQAWTRDAATLVSGPWRAIADVINVDNLIGSAFDDSLAGNGGNNVLVYTGGRDFLDGGSGTDSADFSRFGSAVWVDLAYPGAEAWTRDTTNVVSGAWREIADLANVEHVIGTSHDDSLAGNANANRLDGGAGNDVFAFQPGQAAGDVVAGFTGNGAAAGDTLRFAGFGAGAALTQVGASDFWTISYGAQSETLQLVGVTSLHATDYAFA